ncbi:hypothetical protein SKAU_G00054240, partial [Synaphobranchus kaupii]
KSCLLRLLRGHCLLCFANVSSLPFPVTYQPAFPTLPLPSPTLLPVCYRLSAIRPALPLFSLTIICPWLSPTPYPDPHLALPLHCLLALKCSAGAYYESVSESCVWVHTSWEKRNSSGKDSFPLCYYIGQQSPNPGELWALRVFVFDCNQFRPTKPNGKSKLLSVALIDQ